MAKKPSKPEIKLARLPEPKRRNGATWTALALVLAAGSGALNIGGWVVGIDPASGVSVALGGALISACVVSEGAQLLAMSKAERAWKARPYRQSARFGVLIAMGVMCAGWNGYSAHRAVDVLNAEKRAEFNADYSRNMDNQTAKFSALLDTARQALADLAPAQSPYAAPLAEMQLALAAIPADHSTNRGKMADKIAAEAEKLDRWMSEARTRLSDNVKTAEAAAAAEAARIDKLARAGDISPEFQLGLSAGLELAKLVFLWAGQVELTKRKPARAPINWALHFTTIRRRFGYMAKILPFRKKDAQQIGLNALGLHGKTSA